jgi:SAM-dependent methyltransferase
MARDYSELWDNTAIGRLQREAAWRYFAPLVRSGDMILDLGCGTGEDALRLARHGVRVVGIDASAEMVRAARARGVDAWHCRIEDIGSMSAVFDGVVSNFGALNCVRDLDRVRQLLADITAPGGYLAICVMGRFCLWETVWYGVRGDFRRARRRWKGSADASVGVRVFYPTVKEMESAFRPEFSLVNAAGIGVLVPPSFVGCLPGWLLRWFDGIDRSIAGWPLFSAMADHRVLVFRRTTARGE